MGAGKAGLNIFREAGNPLDSCCVDVSPHVSGHGNNPVPRVPIPQVGFDRLGIITRIDNAHRSLHSVHKSRPIKACGADIPVVQIQHYGSSFRGTLPNWLFTHESE
ncbi:hypothetical protein D3C75_1000250 [compost metagenome]